MRPHGDASRRVPIDGRQIECRTIGEAGPSSPVLVFLHEGLGSVSMWRGFPDRLCAEVGLPGLVYSRPGHGSSDPTTGPYSPGFMHDEATGTLPAVLRAFDIRQPVLFGHSDGASIALIHAGAYPDVARAVVALAPHLFVEPVCVESIAAVTLDFRDTDLRSRLARHHGDVDGMFRRWSDVWLSEAFATWNIEPEVAASRCPILAVQGEDDQYGTMRQIERIAELRPGTHLLKLAACRHSPQFDRPDEVIAATGEFLRGLRLAADSPRT
ncbi:MAG: alpha/beta hydrolase [Burkholderiaceae bacterium]|nr:alpha/beta hydrolase [Burkholderiaceae bacterium]